MTAAREIHTSCRQKSRSEKSRNSKTNRHNPRRQFYRLMTTLLVLILAGGTVAAEVIRLEITDRRPFAENYRFGHTGSYEIVSGRIHGAVDPRNSANGTITDLDLAPVNSSGQVEYWVDFFLLKPIEPTRGNRRLLYDVHNRGNKLALWTFNEAEISNQPSSLKHAGNGFLFKEGYSILWTGWDGDLIDDGTGRLMAGLPVAKNPDGSPVTGRTHVEITVNEPVQSQPFFWSPWGVSAAYPPVDLDEPEAVLTMRAKPGDPSIEVPRNDWAFARWENGKVVPDPASLYVKEGLRPGWLYDLVYTARDPRISGLGLAAIRDAVSFFRYEQRDEAGTPNPLAGELDFAYAFGISQSGRLINHFLYDGFNVDEASRPVFDGTIIHVAGAGKGLFNRRFGMATVYSNARQAHLAPVDTFPFASVAQQDPVTGKKGDLLTRLREASAVPKIVYVQTSTEYWSRGASLLHTDVDGKRDIAVDPSVRIYLVAGAQHLGATPPDPGICQQPRNILNDRPPILRALLVALDEWVGAGKEPPPSRYPRINDGTLVDLETFRRQFPKIPGVGLPTSYYQPLRLDPGSRWETAGIADHVPSKAGSPYRTLVPAVDRDGNERAGIRLPEVAVPVATFTGWNLRADKFGAGGELCPLEGSWLEFARTAEERRRNNDPRPAILERYPSRQHYLEELTDVVIELWKDGYLLAEDALRYIDQAAGLRLWNGASHRERGR